MKTGQTSKEKTRSKSPIIKVRNLSKSFHTGERDQLVLNTVNMDFITEEMAIILGPSGCGKTTLLNVISGVETPTAGNITVRNKSLFSLDEEMRGQFRLENFGMIHQFPYWVNAVKVVDNVAMPLLLKGASHTSARQKAIEALMTVKLTELAEKYPTQLSGGEQQRVLVARAIVTDPKIIIADEPTGNLDTKAGKNVIELLWYLNHVMKKTVIMVTHDLAFVKYATRLFFMRDGSIEDITGKDFIEEKVDDNVRELIDMYTNRVNR